MIRLCNHGIYHLLVEKARGERIGGQQLEGQGAVLKTGLQSMLPKSQLLLGEEAKGSPVWLLQQLD